MAAGLIVLALAWRRAYRGGGSGVVLGGLTRGRTIVSVAFVPTAGLLGLVSLAIVAPLIR